MNKKIQSNEPLNFDPLGHNALEALKNFKVILERCEQFSLRMAGSLGIEEALELMIDILLSLNGNLRLGRSDIKDEPRPTGEYDELGNSRTLTLKPRVILSSEMLEELETIFFMIIELLCSVHRDLYKLKSGRLTHQTFGQMKALKREITKYASEATFRGKFSEADRQISKEIAEQNASLRNRRNEVPIKENPVTKYHTDPIPKIGPVTEVEAKLLLARNEPIWSDRARGSVKFRPGKL